MVERRPNRSQLINFAREELEQFNSGQIPRISKAEELRERFGYVNRNNVHTILSVSGLRAERSVALSKLAQQEAESFVFPSPEWAWMLGVLSLGGSVSEKYGRVALTSCRDVELKEKFILLGERLFSINSKDVPKGSSWGKPTENETTEFNSTKAARAIGNFRRTRWIDTIREKHGWILEEPQFTWAFLEGVFDVKGYPSPNWGIYLFTPSMVVANIMINLLALVGIENVDFVRNAKNREGIEGIRIKKGDDATRFAQQVHSVIHDKERKLEDYRQVQPQKLHRFISAEEVVREWQRLREVFGHTPTRSEIRRFHNTGDTEYGPDVYSKHFGKTEINGTQTRGSFRLAKANIETYIVNKDNNG